LELLRKFNATKGSDPEWVVFIGLFYFRIAWGSVENGRKFPFVPI
jgi:hypothetical protein